MNLLGSGRLRTITYVSGPNIGVPTSICRQKIGRPYRLLRACLLRRAGALGHNPPSSRDTPQASGNA